MKLSEFENILKSNLPKWNVKVKFDSAEFELLDYGTKNKIYFTDLKYIAEYFKINDLILINEIADSDDFISNFIKIKHNLKFEKEDQEE